MMMADFVDTNCTRHFHSASNISNKAAIAQPPLNCTIILLLPSSTITLEIQ